MNQERIVDNAQAARRALKRTFPEHGSLRIVCDWATAGVPTLDSGDAHRIVQKISDAIIDRLLRTRATPLSRQQLELLFADTFNRLRDDVEETIVGLGNIDELLDAVVHGLTGFGEIARAPEQIR